MNENSKEPEIDLGRMQRLLEGFNNHEKEKERLKQKKYKSFCSLMNDDTQMGVSYEDLCMMFNEHGRISGSSNQVKIDNWFEDIISHIDIDDLQTAKAVAVICFINEDQHSMFEIGDILEKIYAMMPEDISINFGVYTTNSVDPEYLEYRVILTGSKIKDDSLKKFNEFTLDDYVFEISDYFLNINNHNCLEATQFFEIEKIDGIIINKEKSTQNHFAINILTNGHIHDILISNNEKNIKTFNSMVQYLMKYKRAIKKIK